MTNSKRKQPLHSVWSGTSDCKWWNSWYLSIIQSKDYKKKIGEMKYLIIKVCKKFLGSVGVLGEIPADPGSIPGVVFSLFFNFHPFHSPYHYFQLTLHFKIKKLLINSSKKYEGVLIMFKHYWFNTHHQDYSRSIFSFLIKSSISEIYWNWRAMH